MIELKRILLIKLLVLLTMILSAQNRFESETYLGIKLGADISGVYTSPSINQKINLGLTRGVVFKHVSQESLGIQLELNYKKAGWSEKLDSANIYTRRFDLLELPFMTHFNFGNNKNRFIVNFGPFLTYLLSENEKIDLLDGFENEDYYGKPVDYKTGYGLCLGIGTSRRTSIGTFQAEGRVSISLSDNFKRSTDFPYSSSKNVNFELSLFYFLNWKNDIKS